MKVILLEFTDIIFMEYDDHNDMLYDAVQCKLCL